VEWWWGWRVGSAEILGIIYVTLERQCGMCQKYVLETQKEKLARVFNLCAR
jgi:hypothetical protein